MCSLADSQSAGGPFLEVFLCRAPPIWTLAPSSATLLSFEHWYLYETEVNFWMFLSSRVSWRQPPTAPQAAVGPASLLCSLFSQGSQFCTIYAYLLENSSLIYFVCFFLVVSCCRLSFTSRGRSLKFCRSVGRWQLLGLWLLYSLQGCGASGWERKLWGNHAVDGGRCLFMSG